MTSSGASGGAAQGSDPRAFVWVSANAGSGKTHLLVERLARILLAGTPPSRILCLTFTNAAAAEMANRLFQALAKWVIADDADLSADIERLTGAKPDAGLLMRARTLFPTALESPGGLKIHTIHAFCERLLHRFALESGVSPHFRLVVDRDQRDLIEAARERVMDDAALGRGDPALADALAEVSRRVHDLRLGDLLAGLVSCRDWIAALDLGDCERRAAVLGYLAVQLGTQPGDTVDSVVAEEFADGAIDLGTAAEVADVLAGGSDNQSRHGARFAALAAASSPQARHAAHHAATLTDTAGTARKDVMVKAMRAAHPGLADWVDTEIARAERIAARLAGAATLAATGALLVLADAVIADYQRAKAVQGLLDYDDLIARARHLLARSDDAAWVLYKLDGGIDHILVDEAQDTSPSQWDIVRMLAEDMLAGASSRTSDTRSTFAVGDEKQSIFSFQGADPAMFATMRDAFAQRAGAAGHDWALVPLLASYRSAPAILAAVDRVFAAPAIAAALSADGLPPRHEPTRSVAGLVEIWSPIAPDPDEASDRWTLPVDYAGAGDARLRLAETIAGEIAGWLARREPLHEGGRAITPGDIMVLVRRRNSFVDALVRALKARHIPVAGVDRMTLTDQIAVADLIAAGRFCLLPQDDLTLAALLKSPLVGLSEDELFQLAHGRPGGLWQALLDAAEAAPRLAEAGARLKRWLTLADRLTPYDFYARLLAENRMRARIAARLGAEAADPIDEFMNAALLYERDHVASLEGFLAWLSRSQGEVKRDLEHGRDEVRVMTVHGAKGLEAPVVILPDTCQTPPAHRGPRETAIDFPSKTDPPGARIPVWAQAGSDRVKAVAQARAESGAAAGREYLRLLYVAMTRARDRLVITGYETRNKRPADCWYDVVMAGLAGHLDEFAAEDGTQRWRMRHAAPVNAAGEPATARAARPAVPGLPGWALAAPSRMAMARRRLTPSNLADEAPGSALSPLGEARSRRFSRGLALHALLEHLPDLPAAARLDAARRYLDAVAGDLDAAARAQLCDEALRVLGLPDFAPFLAPGARAEVAFAASLAAPDGGAVLVEGRVDRLAFIAGTVHVVDYKTHRPAPGTVAGVPAGLIAQMALYRAALAEIHDGRPVAVHILWTDSGVLMRLADDLLEGALHAALSRASGRAP